MVSEPKENPVYAYRSVVIEEGTLTFRFFKSPSEAAKNRASNREIDECCKRILAERAKTPQQKKLEEYARGKELNDTQELLALIILDQEKNPFLNRFKKSVEISKLNVSWNSTGQEFESKDFVAQARAIVSSDKGIQDLIKYAATLEDMVSKLRNFEQMGDSMMNEVLLIQPLLSVAGLLTSEPPSSLATVQRKLKNSFDYKVGKAGSWTETSLPLMITLWETRVCYAFPELSDESGVLLRATR
jgi:hypothetical protein